MTSTPDEQNALKSPSGDSTFDATAVARIGPDIPESPEDQGYALAIESDVAGLAEEIVRAQDAYVPPHWEPGSSQLLFLPDELKLMVVANLPPEKGDTLHLSMTSRELRNMSLTKFWSRVTEDKTLINLVLQPQPIQQAYALISLALKPLYGDSRSIGRPMPTISKARWLMLCGA